MKNILAADGQRARVLSISSSERAAGKSLVSANLGVCFSQLNKKTILVDCDIRNPSMPIYFGYENRLGLAELMEMKLPMSEAILREKMPNLDILPAGVMDRNPTEVLSGDRFAMLINYLKLKYDYVIIDSPPALFVVDAAIVTAASDATILVARYRQTKRAALSLAHKKILQIAPKKIYGLLNGVIDVHEYVNYNSNSYFEDKMKNLRSYVDYKEKVKAKDEHLAAKFEDLLTTDSDKQNERKRGA